jgi:hypothetical protein
VDITDLIMADHQRQRSLFVLLDVTDRDDHRALAAIWKTLAIALEVHAQIEEELFYPRLLAEVPGEDDETKDAIGDHNGIRDGIRAAGRSEVGSTPWWDGVNHARAENDEHLGEEEQGPLAHFRQSAAADERERLAVVFATLEAELTAREYASPGTVQLDDKDPEQYVESGGTRSASGR